MTKEDWEKEIQEYHPIITYFPKEQWPEVTRFNGYLPLPPKGRNV